MRDFTRFLGRSPDTATPEDLRAFQLDMSEKGTGSATFNNRLSVLGFFFSVTCAREEMKRHMRYQRLAKKIPVVLSAEEVTRILDVAPGPGLKYRAAFSVAYGGGLRASEARVPGGPIKPSSSDIAAPPASHQPLIDRCPFRH